MNSKSIKSFAALVLLGTSISASMNPAKADHWCYRWESNCRVDGRTGTSGNDILGLAGGDTVEKAIGIGASSLGGTATVPIIGTVSGAVVGATVAIGNGLYQTYKRERDAYYSRKDAEEQQKQQDEYNEAYRQFERELEAQGIR